ncbi:probable conjugal transfer protein TrbE part 2 [Ylistrum balloti]|uniref:probable conjugal transfer protein TrbE part 2 n=1 Tax=Ylistrum balloti TaxID=509963 RepID=UPI0029059214|nr:probable conjugal transfer protein TrbE part 2 [Ylistrum balloti]
MIQTDVIRKPLTAIDMRGNFDNALCAFLNKEREQQFKDDVAQLFTSDCYLTITYQIPSDQQDKTIQFFVSDEPTDGSLTRSRIRDYFLERLSQVEGVLKNLFFEFRRLSPTELLTYLKCCIDGDDSPVRINANGPYLSYYLASKDFYGGRKPTIGDKHIRTIGIQGFPVESSPQLLSVLHSQPLSYRWHQRLIFYSPEDAKREASRREKKWYQKRQTLIGHLREEAYGDVGRTENQAAVEMSEDAMRAVHDIDRGDIRMGAYSTVVVVMHESSDVVTEQAAFVRDTFEELGFPARIESLNASQAYLGSLPGESEWNGRKSLINTVQFADLMPTTTLWAGHRYHPNDTYPSYSPPLMHTVSTGSTPFRLTPFVGDVGHFIVLGPTGKGKTVLMNQIAVSFNRYQQAELFGFDIKHGLFVTTMAAGGNYYDLLASDSKLQLRPLGYLDDPEGLLWSQQWIKAVLALNDYQVTAEDNNEIIESLKSLRQSPTRTLSEFVLQIQKRMIRDIFVQYTRQGPLGMLLDGEQDTVSESRWNIFEQEKLLDLEERFSAPILLTLFNIADRRMQGQPFYMPYDEGWQAIRNPLIATKYEEALRKFRSKNAAVGMATQSVAEIIGSSLKPVILENVPTKIFLSNPAIYDHRELYQEIGLSEQEVSLISHLVPKQQYYYRSDDGRRIFDLDLRAVSLAFVAATSKQDVQRCKQMMAMHGDAWVSLWLEYKGIDQDWIRYWNQIRKGDLE